MASTARENPGCLASLLNMLGFKRATPGAQAPQFRTRDDFLSPAELSFYHVLQHAVGSRATICPKIGLSDLLFVSRPDKNFSAFNRIAQKHVDFVLCESRTMLPLLAIELDDSSHRRRAAVEKDRFVDAAFEVANLPLIRIPAQREYTLATIQDRLSAVLAPRQAVPATQVPPRPAAEPVPRAPEDLSPPLCPKCGIPMVIRTVRDGPHKGKRFYGCQNFPKCREVKPIDR